MDSVLAPRRRSRPVTANIHSIRSETRHSTRRCSVFHCASITSRGIPCTGITPSPTDLYMNQLVSAQNSDWQYQHCISASAGWRVHGFSPFSSLWGGIIYVYTFFLMIATRTCAQPRQANTICLPSTYVTHPHPIWFPSLFANRRRIKPHGFHALDGVLAN